MPGRVGSGRVLGLVCSGLVCSGLVRSGRVRDRLGRVGRPPLLLPPLLLLLVVVVVVGGNRDRPAVPGPGSPVGVAGC